VPFDVDGTAAPLESRIEARAVKQARKLGWLVFKMGQWSAGWPDRLFMRSDRYVWIEFKRPGKEPTPLQAKRHEELRQQGATVHVCTTWQDALQVLGADDL
jgi:hypothetical protein